MDLITKFIFTKFTLLLTRHYNSFYGLLHSSVYHCGTQFIDYFKFPTILRSFSSINNLDVIKRLLEHRRWTQYLSVIKFQKQGEEWKQAKKHKRKSTRETENKRQNEAPSSQGKCSRLSNLQLMQKRIDPGKPYLKISDIPND